MAVKPRRFAPHSRARLAVLLVAFLAALPAAADVITEIEVAGLKRTRPRAVERELERFRGMDADTLNLDDVRAAILDTGILDPVFVEVRPGMDGDVLFCEVAEKWSVFPIPIVMAGSGGWSAGGFFADANAFGLNDKMTAGGLYSDDGWMAMAMYMHSAEPGRFPGLGASLMYGRAERIRTDQRGKTDGRILSRAETETLAGGVFAA